MHALREQELNKLTRKLKANRNVDVTFLIDCTSSMKPYIHEAKEQIGNIVNKIKLINANRVRIAFVGYRDYCDGSSKLEVLPFTEDLKVFNSFQTGIVAKGGGDTAEDVLGGLKSAINLEWLSANRVIFHVGNAPQHGRRFNDFTTPSDDSDLDGDLNLDVEKLFKELRRINCKYFFGKINETTNKMYYEFAKLGNMDDHEFVSTVDMSDPSLLFLQAVSSITASMRRTGSVGLSLPIIQIGKQSETQDLPDLMEQVELEEELEDVDKMKSL